MTLWSLERIERESWNKLWAKIQGANLLQSWEYGEAKHTAQRWIPHRFLIHDSSGRNRGLVQVLTKTVPFLGGFARINRGPLLLDKDTLNEDYLLNFRHALKAILNYSSQRRWWYLSIAPEMSDSRESQIILRKLGFRLSKNKYAWGSALIGLDVGEEELFNRLRGKWRNLLRKSQRFKIEVLQSTKKEDFDLMTQYYLELQKQAGFKGIPEGIIRTLSVQSGPKFDFFLLWAKEQDSSFPVGMTVIAGHGDTCTYFIGWTSPEGRKLQANYLLLWNAILICKKKGLVGLTLEVLATLQAKGLLTSKQVWAALHTPLSVSGNGI